MGKASFRSAMLGAAALASVVSGCGARASIRPAKTSSSDTTRSRSQISSRDATSAGFAWLRPRPAPAGWRLARIADGAVMAYPAGWRRTAGDVGTATAVRLDGHHRYLGYLNITPRQGAETLTSWASFRVDHNAREGERDVITLAAARGLRFRSGRGSCVRDAYTTTTGARFIELACLVQGRRVSSVIVGAAPPQRWRWMSVLVERAVSAFTT